MTGIFGTGLSGLIGSRVIEHLSGQFSFTNVSKETGFDITDTGQIQELIRSSKAPFVFHFAAYTNVQGSEDEKDKGKESISWIVNVEATKTIADICKKTGKKLLYLSTDYVFDGNKDAYGEEDTPHPISWYGMTKWEGEREILSSGVEYYIIRISTPYRAFPVGKMDFVHKIADRLARNESVTTPKDQWFSPTYIDDLVEAIPLVIRHDQGIYHLGSKAGITPYMAAETICQIYGFSLSLVIPTSYEEYFKNKAKAPKQGVLKHDKIDALGVTLHSFVEGVGEVKQEEAKGVHKV